MLINKEFLKYYLVIVFALTLGILVDFLFYKKSIGASFFVFVSTFLIFSLVLSKNFKKKLSKVQYVLLIPIILFSAMVFLRASGFLFFYNILISLFLISLFLILFSKENLLNFTFTKYFISPLSFLTESFRKSAVFIEGCRDKIKTEKKLGSPKFRSVIKGIILSFPILIIFLLLFYSADIIFQAHLDKLLEKIVFINIDTEIVIRILIILIASYIFIGIFAKSFHAFKSNVKFEKLSTENNQKDNLKFLGSIESSIVLGAVELLFLVFIIIQFLYLFGGKAYVWGIPEYITYAEYAKKGFAELIAVSIISFLLIYGIDKFGKRENFKQNKFFKILSGILVCEIFVIIASAITRLSLYIDGYGYTFSRLFGFIFLYWLCSIFLLFLYKIFKEKKESIFLFSVFWLIILFWGGINFLNPDAYIAQKNIERYIEEKEFDAWHLSRLSEDAVPEIMKFFKINENDEEKIELARELDRRYEIYPYDFSYNDFYFGCPKEPINVIPIQEKESQKIEKWQSFNLSKKKASASLEENSDEIKKYLILFWDKEIGECWKKFDECNKNKSSDYEQDINSQAENLSHFPLLQMPTINKEEECNWIKSECERSQEIKQKLEEFK